MAIRPVEQSPPRKLRAAKLYLDDISQICDILRDSREGFRPTFIIDGSKKCDTIEDLKEHGGLARQFEIRFVSRGMDYAEYTLEIANHGSQLHLYDHRDRSTMWSKYARIAEIFDRRKRHVGLMLLVYGTAAVAIDWYFIHWRHVPIVLNMVVSCGVGLAAGSKLYPFLFGSVVRMRYSYEAGTGRWLEDHKSELIVGAVCAVLGAIVTVLFERIWK